MGNDKFWDAMTELVEEITALVVLVRRQLRRTLLEE